MTMRIKVKRFPGMESLPRFVYALLAVAAVGVAAGIYRLYAGLGSTTNLNTVYPWGLWISFDLTMVAFSGAAFTLAALVYIFHMHDLHPAVRPTVLFGFLGYSSVLVILLFDLGRWDRFWHFIIHPNLTSALFEVSWCILLYTTILAYEFSPVVFEKVKNGEKIIKTLGKILIGMVIAGITLSSMHQSSLGSLFVIQIHRLNPLWYSTFQPALFLVSSLAAGISTVLIGAYLSIWLYGQTLSLKAFEKLGRLLPWILGVYLALRLADFVLGRKWGLLPTSGVRSVVFVVELLLFAIGAVWFSFKQLRSTRKSAFIGALFIAAGIALNRFNITWFAMKPLQGVTYFPSLIEIMVIIGVASGVLAVYTLLAYYFPVFSETERVDPKKISAERLQPAQQPVQMPAGD